MSIQAQIVSSGGVVGGTLSAATYDAIADLGRRVANLEAARTVIEAGTITAGTIAAGSITTTEIAAGTIQASDIASGTITATQIASGTITATQIAAGTITASNIAAGTITATQIAAGSITTGNIAAGAITSSLIAALAINAGHIQAGSISATHIASHTITANEIAAGSITTAEIAAGTIIANDIASGTITATQIAAGTITSTQIAAATITAGNIVSHTITALQIAAGTITATEITAATITGSLIAATTITAANIASGTITSTQLAANSVTATQIVSGAVDATKISVSSLSAISANMGTITAGTVTGATVQTAASGARVVLNTGGITAYNAGGVPQLAFDVSTGSLTLTGTVTANATSVLPVGALSGTLGSGSFVQNGSFEDGVLAEWATNVNVTLSSNAGQARSGTRSGSMASVASGTMSIIQANASRAIVLPSINYTASAWFRAAVSARTVRVHINWYTSANVFISTSSSTATTTDSTTTWTRTTLTAQSPSNAFFARVIAEVVSTGGAAETHSVDDVTLAIGDFPVDFPALPQNTIVGSMMIADQITAREIAASTITATEIAAVTITAGQIATGTITATQIAAGTITATQLSATAIDSMIVTGATIQTNTNVSRNKVILDVSGLRAYGTPLVAPGMVASWIQTFKGLGANAAPLWPLSDTTGTDAFDYGGIGHTGTYVGGVTHSQTGMTGDGALATLFNGTTGEVTGGAGSIVTNPSTFTIHAGFKTTTTSGGGIVTFMDTQSGAPTSNDRKVWMDNAGKIWFGIWTGSAVTINSPLSYNDGNYHRVYAIKKSNHNMELWIDGTLVASNSNTTAQVAFNGYWRIARGSTASWPSTTTSNFFNGTLAMVGVLPWAIGSTQIAKLEATLSNPELSLGFVAMYNSGGYALTPDTTYYYAVTAINNQGETPASDVIQIHTGGGAALYQTNFNFTPLANSNSYRVYRSTTAGTFTQYFVFTPLFDPLAPGELLSPQQVQDDGNITMLTNTPPTGLGTAYTKIIDVDTSGNGIITGPTIRTSEMFPKVQLDSSGLIGYDETGDEVFKLASSGQGLSLRAGSGDRNSVSWMTTGDVSMGAIWGSGVDAATSTINISTRNIAIKSYTGSAPPPGQKRPTTGSQTTVLTADGTTLTVGNGATGAANARKLLDTSNDSDWSIVVYKRQSTTSTSLNIDNVMSGYPGGVYLVWVRIWGANKSAHTMCLVTKPNETNLTPGISYLTDASYAGGGNTFVQDMTATVGAGLVLTSVGNDGIRIGVDGNGVSCTYDIRIVRLTALASAATLG